MVLTSDSTDPTNFGLGGGGGIPSKDNMVLTYGVKASSSVSKGDWVKLSDSKVGAIEKVSATSDTPVGVAFVDVDNSDGSDNDKFCSVLRKGFAYVTAVTASGSGVVGKAIYMDSTLQLSQSLSYNPYTAQTLSSSGNGPSVAKALDHVAQPSGDATFTKIRVFLDRMSASGILN